MLAIDVTDGVLMLRVYGRAFVKPPRKLYYNMMLALTSILLAFFIAGIGAINLLQGYFHLNSSFWPIVRQMHENYTATSIFTLSWVGSKAVYRIKRYDVN
jgi:high-affinity nickel-transport protein